MKMNQRIVLTKRLLQEALLQILQTKPIDKISVTELCSAAGINRATFYRHYQIPRDVLMDMRLAFIQNIHDQFKIAPLSCDPATILEKLCVHLYDHAALIQIFIKNDSDADLMHLFQQIFQQFLQENARLHPFADLDADSLSLVCAYMAGGGYYMLRQWLTEDIHKSPKEIAQLATSFLNDLYSKRA